MNEQNVPVKKEQQPVERQKFLDQKKTKQNSIMCYSLKLYVI